jgi:hypothetical protein
MSKELFQQFNKLYFDFLSFLKSHSNGDKLFNSFYKKNYIIKNTNIKLFIKGWYDNITINYYQSIIEENILFFLKKDYNSDIVQLENSNDIIKYIKYFKDNYDKFEKKVTDDFIGYIKQLTKLSYMYFNAKDI